MPGARSFGSKMEDLEIAEFTEACGMASLLFAVAYHKRDTLLSTRWTAPELDL